MNSSQADHLQPIMASTQILCTCTHCCPSRWNQAAVFLQRTGSWVAQKEVVMACAFRDPGPLPQPGVEVFPGHQAVQPMKLTVDSVPIKDMLKGLTSAHKDARYVSIGKQRLYLVYSYLVDMNVNSYRRQYIASPDGKTKYCYFERVLLSHPKNHNYVCKSAEGDAVLFTVERNGVKDLVVKIYGGHHARQDLHSNTFVPSNRPTLHFKYKGGTLKWHEQESGQVWRCGHIQERTIVVEPFMDQIVAVALSAIMRDIANVGGLLKAAELAAPKPMTGAAGVAMRGANYVLASEPGNQKAPTSREGMAIQMAGDFMRSRKPTRDGDSGYESGFSTRDQSVNTQSSRMADRSQSRERGRQRGRSDPYQTAGSVLKIGADLYDLHAANRTRSVPRQHDAHLAYGPPSDRHQEILQTAGSVLKFSSELYNAHTVNRAQSVPRPPQPQYVERPSSSRQDMLRTAGSVLKQGIDVYTKHKRQ